MGMLDGKVAIVTGGGRGIGSEQALLLSAEGASVVVNDLGGTWTGEGIDASPALDVVEKIQQSGGRAVANFSDVSTPEGATELMNQALDEFGDLHILVNNAGILRDGMIFSIEPEQWRSVLDVHLLGHFYPTRAAAIYWRKRGKEDTSGALPHRALINTTSESGLFGNAGQSNYDVAKMGIVGFTVAMSRELAKYRVTSNAIAPRARTRLTSNTFEGTTREGEFSDSKAEFDAMDPGNIAPWVGFLATDKAASITGQVFIVCGGIIGRVRLPHLESHIIKEQRWTVSELADAAHELFRTLPSDHLEGPRGYARLPKQ
jgi:NAD(P)-dependent dehydrogenase (short-subunit alcohol dehydrogenase family)